MSGEGLMADGPWTVAVSGSHGLIGSALVERLVASGHRVKRIVRSVSTGPDEVGWHPGQGRIEADQLEGVDAVVHLAGESIMGRWTKRKMQRIRDSRVEGTRVLAQALASLSHRPRVLVSASAMGYYGDRGDELLDESSAPGQGFLPQVCIEWEQAAEPARAAQIRVVHARMGLVLSERGGALAQMLPIFRLGLGGRLGDGRMWWSWIALEDAVGAIIHALQTPAISGPMNVASPNPVTNRQFTRVLARVLRRPAVLPVPRWAAYLALGRMAREGLFSSVRLRPGQLERTGYVFDHPDLEPALRAILGR
ncbi:MAG TPA: TIGR01777 family oxidoreductase [Phycisphaeraceae bacterium]